MINNVRGYLHSLSSFIYELKHLSMSQWDIEDNATQASYKCDIRQRR